MKHVLYRSKLPDVYRRSVIFYNIGGRIIDMCKDLEGDVGIE